MLGVYTLVYNYTCLQKGPFQPTTFVIMILLVLWQSLVKADKKAHLKSASLDSIQAE